MATRQEIQTALDIIRFANCAQDLFNNYSKVARGEVNKTVGDFGAQTEVAMTDEEITAELIRGTENISNYTGVIKDYLLSPEKRTLAENGLVALGVDIREIESDIATFDGKTEEIKTGLSDEKISLSDIGTSIDADIPDLNLVRNR